MTTTLDAFPVADPPAAGGERETLLAFLQRQRDLVAWKLLDASDEALRSVATATGLNAHGLVNHLTQVERSWVRGCFDDEKHLEFDWTDADPDAEMRVPSTVTMADLLAAYAVEQRRTDAVISGAALDDMATTRPVSLRWIVVHLIEETARHLGHLDLLREMADGVVGEEP